MAKFYGIIGFAETKETAPGVWAEDISEHNYYGDVTRSTRRLDNGEYLNDNIVVNNTFSIVADAYAYENFANMRYICWMGTRWKVTNVEVQPPRLILTVGGVYNGKTGPADALGEIANHN